MTKRLMLTFATAAALALLAAPTIGQTEHGISWSGYLVGGETFTEISAKWRQPKVKCTTNNARASFWVGISGDHTLQQSGIVAVCNSTGAPQYYKAFWEVIKTDNSSTGQETFTAAPGDEMEATVKYKDGQVTMIVKDETNHGKLEVTKPCSGANCPRSVAEWIVERPGSGTYPLADYGSATFKDLKVKGEHGTEEHKLKYTPYVMESASGRTLSSCGSMDKDDHEKSFTCSFKAAE